MKKLLLIINFLLITIIYFSNSLALYIEIADDLELEKNIIFNLIQNKFSNVNVQIRDENYYTKNIQLEPLELALLIEINDIYIDQKINYESVFYSDRRGNYINYKGEYHQINNKRLFRYEFGRYIYDPNGDYIYLEDYQWASVESDKYFKYENFYSKRTNKIKFYKLFLRGYYQFIDTRKAYIISSGLLDEEIISYDYRDYYNLLKKSINKINYIDRTFYEEKPSIAINIQTNNYITSYLENKIYNQVRYIFDNQPRYNIFERNNLEKILEELRIKMITNTPKQIADQLNNVEYYVLIKINSFNIEYYKNNKNYFFNNSFNGNYVNKNLIVPGKRYRRKSENDEIIYIQDYYGDWVKKVKQIWDREENYIRYNTPQELIQYPTQYLYANLVVNYIIIKTSTGEIIYDKVKNVRDEIILEYLSDRNLSTNQNFISDLYDSIVKKAVLGIENDINRLFAIEGQVVDKKNNKIQIDVGDNLGVNRRSYFRITDDIITVGHAQIINVKEFDSELNIVQTYKDYGNIEVNNIAIEDFDYSKPSPIIFSLFNRKQTELGLKLSYRHRNLENDTIFYTGVGGSYNLLSTEEKYDLTYSFNFSYNLIKLFNSYFSSGISFYINHEIIQIEEDNYNNLINFTINPYIEINQMNKKNNMSGFARFILYPEFNLEIGITIY